MINVKLNKHLKIHKTFLNQKFETQISSLDQTLHPNYTFYTYTTKTVET
jgi:hypothetical protein